MKEILFILAILAGVILVFAFGYLIGCIFKLDKYL